MRVSSFNIRHGLAPDGPNRWDVRCDLVCSFLQEYRFDLLGLQEALDFQVEMILRALPKYRWIGVGREDEQKGESCPILFNTERLSATESGTFWLSDTPTVVGSSTWGNDVPRICTWARFEQVDYDAGFYLFNTHLDHKIKRSRYLAAKLIKKHLQQIASSSPVILLGDFNTHSMSSTMQVLRGEVCIEDVDENVFLADTYRVAHPDIDDACSFHGFGGHTTAPSPRSQSRGVSA